MSVAWPSTLPLPQFGLRYNVADPQMRTLMASGRTISRRRFSDVPTEFPARWILRQSEAEIFEQFYQNDAVDGSEWIEMPLVTAQGEGVHYVRFRGAYRYRRVGADLWEYSANLQMYLRSGSPESPPVEPLVVPVNSGYWVIGSRVGVDAEFVSGPGYAFAEATRFAGYESWILFSITSIGDWYINLTPGIIEVKYSCYGDTGAPGSILSGSLGAQKGATIFGSSWVEDLTPYTPGVRHSKTVQGVFSENASAFVISCQVTVPTFVTNMRIESVIIK